MLSMFYTANIIKGGQPSVSGGDKEAQGISDGRVGVGEGVQWWLRWLGWKGIWGGESHSSFLGQVAVTYGTMPREIEQN